jgi:hypothetical protein
VGNVDTDVQWRSHGQRKPETGKLSRWSSVERIVVLELAALLLSGQSDCVTILNKAHDFAASCVYVPLAVLGFQLLDL